MCLKRVFHSGNSLFCTRCNVVSLSDVAHCTLLRYSAIQSRVQIVCSLLSLLHFLFSFFLFFTTFTTACMCRERSEKKQRKVAALVVQCMRLSRHGPGLCARALVLHCAGDTNEETTKTFPLYSAPPPPTTRWCICYSASDCLFACCTDTLRDIS